MLSAMRRCQPEVRIALRCFHIFLTMLVKSSAIWFDQSTDKVKIGQHFGFKANIFQLIVHKFEKSQFFVNISGKNVNILVSQVNILQLIVQNFENSPLLSIFQVKNCQNFGFLGQLGQNFGFKVNVFQLLVQKFEKSQFFVNISGKTVKILVFKVNIFRF